MPRSRIFCNEIEMVALGVVDPQHVVEQQCVAIAGRQTLMSAPWRADHHLAQLADLRMNAKLNLLRHDNEPPLLKHCSDRDVAGREPVNADGAADHCGDEDHPLDRREN